MIKLALILTFTFILHNLEVLALPGDEVTTFGTPSACLGDTPAQTLSNLQDLARATMCIGFGEDQISEMCECHENLFGNTLNRNPEYLAFQADLERFDARVTAKVEFSNNPTTLKIATIMNLIGSMQEPQISPFSDGGACRGKFGELQNSLNMDLSVIPEILNREVNFDFLASEGLTRDSLQQRMQNFFQLAPGTDQILSPTMTFANMESEDSYDILFRESVLLLEQHGDPEVRLAPDGVSPGGLDQRFPINNQKMMDALCDNLVTSLRRDVEEEEVFTTMGTFIDRETNISQKNLNSTDVPAFLGLRDQFMETATPDSPMTAAFFNNLFCQNFDDDTLDEIPTADEQYARDLSDEELREEIMDLTAFMQQSDQEFRAATVEIESAEDLMDESWERLGTLLREMGFDPNEFKERLEDFTEADRENVLAFLQPILEERYPGGYETGENLANLMANILDYDSKRREYNELFSVYSYNMGMQAENQYKLDQYFQELSHRRGGVQQAAAYVGLEHLHSQTALYYAGISAQNDPRVHGPVAPEFFHVTGMMMGVAAGGHLAAVTGIANQRLERFRNVAREIMREDETSGVFTEEEREERRLALEVTEQQKISTTRQVFAVANSYRSGGSLEQGRNSRNSPTKRSFMDEATRQLEDARRSGTLLSSSGQVRSAGSDNGPRRAPANTTTDFATEIERGVIRANNNAALRRDAIGLPQTRTVPRPSDIPVPARVNNNGEAIDTGISSALSRIDKGLSALESRNGDDSRGEDPALRAELAAVRAQIEELRERNRELLAQNRVNNAVAVPTPAPTGTTSPIAIPTATGTPVISGGGGSNGGTARATAGAVAAPGVSAPAGTSPTGAGGGGTPDASPAIIRNTVRSSVPSNLEATGTDPVELTLVSGNLGFALVQSPVEGISMRNTSVDFLALSDVEKAQFMENFFRETEESYAYIRQSDGRLVLLERNREFVPGASSGQELRVEENLVREQADIIIRLQGLEKILDQALL